ncbi:branched-chain amino acid transaminase [Candidatus Gottesmanbacteria bacterium]|nr:branched-chain amino acid transaminase [Candidatus Gottesmanbacteria bacterium]MBI5452488.1 branched-chain amino acid transaminase [Candidatus Gottesmanbacteria bacterium]
MTESEYFPFAFFEGKIVPTELARINVMNNALQYGNAIFGGIRGYLSADKKHIHIFRMSDHYLRFLKSLRILNKLIRYDLRKLFEITVELAKKNQPKTDCYFRPFTYATNFEISPDLSKLDFDFALYMIPMGEYLPVSKGLRLIVSNWVRINDNMIPSRAKISGGYVNSSLAKGDAVKLGFDDALMLTSDGHIAEGSGSNFFIVRDGRLITSAQYNDVLEGITRRTIIELAKELKIAVEERPVDRTEVYIADEAFFAGTGVQVAWIAEVDGRMIGNGKIGPITARLQKLFFDIVRGKEKKYSGWLTKI